MLIVHHGFTYKCDMCTEEFTRPDKLKNHKKNTHLNQVPPTHINGPPPGVVGPNGGIIRTGGLTASANTTAIPVVGPTAAAAASHLAAQQQAKNSMAAAAAAAAAASAAAAAAAVSGQPVLQGHII